MNLVPASPGLFWTRSCLGFGASPALPPQGRRDLKLLRAHFRGAWVPEHPPELPDSRELFLV